MAGNNDGFYQEAAFLMGIAADLLRRRVRDDIGAFKVQELKQLLQILKDKHYDVLGYHHHDLRLTGNKQELADRLQGFLEGEGMEQLRAKGAFAVVPGWQAPPPPPPGNGGTMSNGGTAGMAAAAPSGREVICIESSDEEEDQKPQGAGPMETQLGLLFGDEDEEEEEEEEEEYEAPRLRRGRPRTTHHVQHAPPPPRIPNLPQHAMHAPFGMPMHGLNMHMQQQQPPPGPGFHVNYSDFVMGAMMPAFIGGGGPMGLGPPMMPHVVQGGVGEPKRHSAGKGGNSPTGKKARTAGEARAHQGGGNVEVKLEPVDPFTAMKPTVMERGVTMAMMNESGIGAAECLTALRLTNYNVQDAINFFVSALDYERNDIETLAAASIASEEENDRRKAAQRQAMEKLKHTGDVLGDKMFADSLLLNATHGSRALRAFLSAYCSTSAPPSSPPPSPTPVTDPPHPPPMAQRRSHIVRLLTWELRGVKCYRDPAKAYITSLIQRLDAHMDALHTPPPPIPPPANSSTTPQDQEQQKEEEEEARWERCLPLEMLRREADVLQDCIVAYPSGNTNGVPPLFLQAMGHQRSIEQDGVELLLDLDAADDKGGAGGEAAGGRKSVQPECIEIEDDD